ncbi:MAG: hypothetical protein FWC27_03590 [Firmicutes bacterium]|nr:hypothetical protein [Bacillota bacterium]
MKKLLSILLAVLLLGSVATVGLTAAAAPSANTLVDLAAFFLKNDAAKLTDAQLKTLIELLDVLKRAGFNYEKILDTYSGKLPIAAKAALHKAGVMSYPIWERDVFFNFIFKYFLLGFLWM